MKDFTLTDLIDLETLQKIQDGFSKFTGIAAVTTDAEGRAITKPSKWCHFCADIVRGTPLGKARCEDCDRHGALLSLDNKNLKIYRCHTGLSEFAAPIIVEDEFMGSLVCGQIHTEKLTLEQVKDIALELNLDPDVFLREINNTQSISMEKLEHAAEFLTELAGTISQMAFKNYKALQKSQKTEKAARSQFLYVSQMANDLKKDMDNWYDVITQAERKDSLSEIKDNLRSILTTSSELYSMIQDSVGYIQLTEGKVDLEEGIYNIRERFQLLFDAIRKSSIQHQFNVDISFDDSVPQKLYGDSGRIGQVVTRLLFDIVENSGAKNYAIFIDCKDKDYAKMLDIHISETGAFFDDDQLLQITQYLEFGAMRIMETKMITGMGLPVINMLVKHLYGKISIQNTAAGIEYLVSIPQLEVTEENKNGF